MKYRVSLFLSLLVFFQCSENHDMNTVTLEKEMHRANLIYNYKIDPDIKFDCSAIDKFDIVYAIGKVDYFIFTYDTPTNIISLSEEFYSREFSFDSPLVWNPEEEFGLLFGKRANDTSPSIDVSFILTMKFDTNLVTSHEIYDGN